MLHGFPWSRMSKTRMSARLLAVLALGTVAGSSCAQHVPETTHVAPGTPHVTWVLMFGDRDNPDQEFVCQSGSGAACVLPASRPDAQVFSHLHLYYHGAGSQTRYEGTKNIGHLQGSPESHTSPTNITVQKNESITNQSVTGIVTSAPGTYAVTLNLTATMADVRKAYPIRETIQITVK